MRWKFLASVMTLKKTCMLLQWKDVGKKVWLTLCVVEWKAESDVIGWEIAIGKERDEFKSCQWEKTEWFHTVDGQIMQTLDTFSHAPPPPQISKLFSTSKGWDGWTKEINPHSMTCHAHVVNFDIWGWGCQPNLSSRFDYFFIVYLRISTVCWGMFKPCNSGKIHHHY